MAQETLSFFLSKQFKILCATTIFVILTLWWNLLYEGDALGELSKVNADTRSNNTSSNANKQRKQMGSIPTESSQNSENTSRRKGIILFWNSYWLTSGVGLDGVRTIPYDCGVYQCNVTKDRSYLTQSHAIILNPRETKGIFILSYPIKIIGVLWYLDRIGTKFLNKRDKFPINLCICHV